MVEGGIKKLQDDWRGFVPKYLKGKGLEIGAAFAPFPINEQTSVVYVDYVDTEALKVIHDKYANTVVDVNIVARADKLSCLEDEQFDFILNSHVFEHLVNPMRALFEWLRILKKGGYIYMVVPDKRFTFDIKRPTTDYMHIIQDYINGTDEAELAHYMDFCDNVDGQTNEMALNWHKEQHDIHLHTFTEKSLTDLLDYYEDNDTYKIMEIQRYEMNICVLLKKE